MRQTSANNLALFVHKNFHYENDQIFDLVLKLYVRVVKAKEFLLVTVHDNK